jgi:hypothetical protein
MTHARAHVSDRPVLSACPKCGAAAEIPAFATASCSNRSCEYWRTGLTFDGWNRRAASSGNKQT